MRKKYNEKKEEVTKREVKRGQEEKDTQVIHADDSYDDSR